MLPDRRREERRGGRGDPENSHWEAGNGGAARCEEWGAFFTHTPTQSLPAHPITASRYVTVVGLSHVTSQEEAWEGKGGTAASWRGTAIRGTKAQRHVPRYAQIVWL